MKCLKQRCYSPVACGGFGYCREHNDPLQSPQYIVEGIILRRLHEKRIEGYTIEMAKEIVGALALSPAHREGKS